MLPAAYSWSVAAFAIALAFPVLWIFRRFSDQAAIARAKRQVRAHLYAFRVYADEPRLIFRAQKQLLVWNGRYLGLMLRPAAIMLVPAVLLVAGLDAMYGRRALAPGEAAVVTARLRGDTAGDSPVLEGRGVVVETPAVRVPDEHQVCWRVRARDTAGSVIVRVAGAAVEKNVRADGGLGPLTFDWPGHGGPVSSIDIAYPPARLRIFGFEVHWLIWFVVVNLAAVLILGKLLGIRF